jgi:hypothetical protein
LLAAGKLNGNYLFHGILVFCAAQEMMSLQAGRHAAPMENLRCRLFVRTRPPLSRSGEWKGAEATCGIGLEKK